ncbi:hypothetical protein Daus18300_000671 [Diaporthe australafricana]|uniref:Uncharacterized protein n=1 Tax=Diaporthe australafricana TaxID=127596 RepID=A0ABR3Y2K7_9PEZI
MERPAKRQRISLGSLGTDDEDEDELDCEPNELNQRRDPAYQLEQARSRASNKLKSRFEDIFAKYEKDFTGVGDEINLSTGEVVVNNGHLQSIVGAQEFGDGDSDGDEDENFSRTERPGHGTSNWDSGTRSSDALASRNPLILVDSSLDWPRPVAGMAGPMVLSSMMFPAHESFMPPDRSFDSWESGHTKGIDPAWQAPELPRPAFLSPHFGAQAQQYRRGTGQITKKVARRSLLDSRGQDGDDEDVLGVPGNVLGKKESPLIKNKFPAVGSSPNNDSSLHEMIQDVIENIADTSPLVEKPRKGSSVTKAPEKTRMKPIWPDADRKGRQDRYQTSKNRRQTKLKADGISSSGDSAVLSDNKGRGYQVMVASPVKAVQVHKTRKSRTLSEQHPAVTLDEPDISGTDEDSFLDITGNTPVKPAGQTLYVEIKARKLSQNDGGFARYYLENDEVETVDRDFSGVEISDQRPQQSSLCTPLDTEENAADPQDEKHVAESATNGIDPEIKEPSDDGAFGRTKPNPASAFSQGENPTTRKTRKQKYAAAPAGIDGSAHQESRPTVLQQHAKERFERNVVDPSYAFSDDENLLPRREKSNRLNSEPVSRANRVAQDTSKVDTESNTGAFQQTNLALHAPNQERRNRAVRTSPKSIVERDTAMDEIEVFKPSQVQTPEYMASFDDSQAMPSSASYRRTRSNRSDEAAVEQLRPQATEKTDARTLKGRCQRKSGDGILGPLGLGHQPASAVASVSVDAEVDATSSEPPKAAESAQLPPSTPQPKSKSRPEKTASCKSGLISLLSDDEDDQDEISFNLADFTPSGHHRIVALRPHHYQTATASTTKKRRGGSLLFGPASTSKANRHSTPGSDSKGRKNRRRSTNSLARSVIKVRRESPRAPSPAGSVVQTPGGTKRRCGEDGFRCERDFCFVCISI